MGIRGLKQKNYKNRRFQQRTLVRKRKIEQKCMVRNCRKLDEKKNVYMQWPKDHLYVHTKIELNCEKDSKRDW